MSELQLKITMGNIDINLQGEGELVYKIFKELREEGLGSLQKGQAHSTLSKGNAANDADDESEHSESGTSSEKKPRNRKKNNTRQPQLVKDLDLSGTGLKKSFKRSY